MGLISAYWTALVARIGVPGAIAVIAASAMVLLILLAAIL